MRTTAQRIKIKDSNLKILRELNLDRLEKINELLILLDNSRKTVEELKAEVSLLNKEKVILNIVIDSTKRIAKEALEILPSPQDQSKFTLYARIKNL